MLRAVYVCIYDEYPLLCKTVLAVRINVFSAAANPFNICFNLGNFCPYKRFFWEQSFSLWKMQAVVECQCHNRTSIDQPREDAHLWERYSNLKIKSTMKAKHFLPSMPDVRAHFFSGRLILFTPPKPSPNTYRLNFKNWWSIWAN